MPHLFVIAGHGAGDSGAVGNGFQEAERVRALAGKIAQYGGADVTIADTDRNWYADNGIATVNIPANWEILELHMDSGVPSAKGAHIIVKEGVGADSYDYALADFLAETFPGRAERIVGRGDLANSNRSYARGFSYRLAEVGFITNVDDINIFNSRMDDIARGILRSFGITSEGDMIQKPMIINATIQNNTGEEYMRLIFDNDKIYDKENGYFLTAAAAAANANVDFRSFDCGDFQKWRLVEAEYKNADYLMLESLAAPKYYLSVEKNGNGSNNLKLYTDLHNQQQKFYVREESDNTTLLIHVFTGKCVSCRE